MTSKSPYALRYKTPGLISLDCAPLTPELTASALSMYAGVASTLDILAARLLKLLSSPDKFFNCSQVWLNGSLFLNSFAGSSMSSILAPILYST